MATRIRLARRGRKRKPIYDIVVADKRVKRDGRFIERLGLFNPNVEPNQLEIFEDRALHWVMVGAEPSETVRKLLSRCGVMLRKHLQVGVNKGAITQETADERYAKWLEERKAALGGKMPFTSKSNPVEENDVVEETPVKEEATATETVAEDKVDAPEQSAEAKEEARVEEVAPEAPKAEDAEGEEKKDKSADA